MSQGGQSNYYSEGIMGWCEGKVGQCVSHLEGIVGQGGQSTSRLEGMVGQGGQGTSCLEGMVSWGG